MAARGSRGTSSLLTPLNVIDILIPDEVVQYNERKHWASLIQPFFETISVLIFMTMFAGGLPNGALGGFLIVLAFVTLAIIWWQRKWDPRLAGLTILALVLGLVLFGTESFSITIIVVAALRFVYRAAMWAFYERLFITNRRVIVSAGFLGAVANSMPLTRVTDIAFRRSVPGEILGYGTLRIESAGQDQALGLLTFLNEPDIFYNILIGLSTTALGSVKDPLSREQMEESRAVTVKPRGERPVRMSFLRRRAGTTPAGSPRTITSDEFDDGT